MHYAQSRLTKQISRLNSQRIAQSLDDTDRRIARATLDIADVCTVNLGKVRKRLLAQSTFGAESSEVRAKAFANIHLGEVHVSSTKGLQTMSDINR